MPIGYNEDELLWLYHIPVWPMDNCSANRASNGLKTMIDIVRRHEYNFLCGTIGDMGPFVPTVMVSCMLHDSNLVNVLLSKMLRELDTTKPDPFQPHVNPAISTIKGNKANESFSFNAVRFIAGCFKKSKDWKAFMRSVYNDAGGIAPIKSSRFWAALLIGGDYLFPRFDQIWEFYEAIKNAQKDKQIVATLEDVLKNKELFEFDCLLMAVDYHGFHSEFNFGACHNECDVQAKEVERIVAMHKQCMKQNRQGVQKMLEYWRKHAIPAITDRKMLQWRLQRYKDNSICARPTEQEEEEQRRLFEVEAAQDPLLDPPTSCYARMRCMHIAIVSKLEEMLDEICLGKASIQQQLSRAPNQQLPVEDIFNFSRKQHDKCCVTRIGILDARRRVQTAPPLGTVGGIPRPYSLVNPPRWYPDWLRQRLRQRARMTISEEWPSQDERADLRWQTICDAAIIADARCKALQEKVEGTERTIMTLAGGYIGRPSEERQRLAPLHCLTLEQFEQVEWGESWKSSGWTVAVISNQLRLRNINLDKRTESESKLLVRKGVIKKETDALVVTGNRKQLIKRLRLIVEAEHAAAMKDKAVSAVERELEAQSQQADRNRERRSRATRGIVPAKYRGE